MTTAPVICFGQQPCGFFPRRFLVAKFLTARRLQAEIGGRIVFFFHDSDHDPRETQTILRDRRSGERRMLNFAFENKLQRKYSPLYAKRMVPGWHEKTARQLGALVEAQTLELFRGVDAPTVADFCLGIYRAMGLLDGIEVVRSSAPEVRCAACEVADFFVDVPYEGEIVRARRVEENLQLHAGGGATVDLPPLEYGKAQISPARDSRLRWMQSVIGCTHYIAGLGEQAYLHRDDAPEIEFVNRDPIDHPDEACSALPLQ